MNLVKALSVVQTSSFKKTVKKLKSNQKQELDTVIKKLMTQPTLGEPKKSDLAFMRVYKFKMNNQLTLLGYSFDDGCLVLELIAMGGHENFYRDLKR